MVGADLGIPVAALAAILEGDADPVAGDRIGAGVAHLVVAIAVAAVRIEGGDRAVVIVAERATDDEVAQRFAGKRRHGGLARRADLIDIEGRLGGLASR